MNAEGNYGNGDPTPGPLEVLRELVRLKNIKERIDRAEASVSEREDYRTNKAKAWTAARHLCGAIHTREGL